MAPFTIMDVLKSLNSPCAVSLQAKKKFLKKFIITARKAELAILNIYMFEGKP